MLAHKARDRAPVPERPPRQEAAVGDGGVRVRDDRLRDVPALPARLRGPVAEVDVLAVQPDSPRRSRRARRASRGAGGGTRRASSPPGPARSAGPRAGSGRPGASPGGGSLRSGVRRTIVPLTVGKLRRDGCQRPSGKRSCGPITPARGMRLGELDEELDRVCARLGVRVRDDARTGRSSRRCPVFAFAAKPSARSLTISRASTSGAGGFATTTSSSTWGASAARQRSSAGSRPVRDDDAGDAHMSSR